MDSLYRKYLEMFKLSLDITQPILKSSLEENSTVEFKKSLYTKGETIDKDYLKTISGFANNSGGVIIMGVEPDSKELVGIRSNYENLDNRYISTTVREGLDGSFEYSFFTQRFLDKVIGFLVVKEATTKPIIMKVDSSSFKFGEVYYRYPAQTAKILAADLRRILNDEVSRRLQSMIGNITNLVDLGDAGAILNTKSGEIQTGITAPKLVLDEKILDKLNLIKEGQITESEGAPAYVIKGNIEVGNVEVIEKTFPAIINESDIYESFFKSECDAPRILLEKLIFHNSHYLPIYFFIRESGFTKEEAIEYINSIQKPDVNISTREKIIQRLYNSEHKAQGKIVESISDTIDQQLEFAAQVETIKNRESVRFNDIQIERTLIFNTLCQLKPIPDSLLNTQTKRIIEAFSNISAEILLLSPKYYLELLSRLNKINKSHDAATLFRKVVCFVDETYYSTPLVIHP